MLVVSDIDIKDEPFFSSSDDNEVGWVYIYEIETQKNVRLYVCNRNSLARIVHFFAVPM